jgi:DNA-binding GntR family transcriptional regulator
VRASERVYGALRDEIVAWRLAPGSELSEVEQAERWGVSRTPVREALGRLTSDGLAVLGKGRTLVVSDLSPVEVARLFELREALETQAARLAARRGDAEVFRALSERFAGAGALLDTDDRGLTAYYDLVADLDAAIDEAMASPYLLRSLVGLRAHVARARRLAQDDTARLRQAAQEHRLIAEAIAEHDELLAAQATAVHLRASLAAVVTGLDQQRPARTTDGPARTPDAPARAGLVSPATTGATA